jgi:hypothetical protein
MCNSHLQRSFEVSEDLIQQANTIEQSCSHDGCLVLAGILRDCGLKVRGATVRAQDEMGREMEEGSNCLTGTVDSAS